MAVLDLEITNGWVVVVVGNCGDWEAWRSGNVVVGKCGGWEMWWLGSVTVGKCGGWEVWWLGTVDWSGAQFAAADAKRKSYASAWRAQWRLCSHEASVTTSSRQCAHIAMYHAILLPEYKGCFSSAYLI